MVVSKILKKKNFYLSNDYDFEKDKENFEEVGRPICLKEVIGNCVDVLRMKVIPDGVSFELYEIASILEKNGRPIERSKKKKGSRMVMNRMFSNGRCNW